MDVAFFGASEAQPPPVRIGGDGAAPAVVAIHATALYAVRSSTTVTPDARGALACQALTALADAAVWVGLNRRSAVGTGAHALAVLRSSVRSS